MKVLIDIASLCVFSSIFISRFLNIFLLHITAKHHSFIFLFYLSCRCTLQMGSSYLNLAPMERGMASSMLQQVSLWILMETSLLLTGVTVGFRLALENHISLNPERRLLSVSLTYPTSLCCITHQVFDSSGSFLSYINTSADPLYGPQGLALTSDGHVVVADSGNHCFKVYRYLQ